MLCKNLYKTLCTHLCVQSLQLEGDECESVCETTFCTLGPPPNCFWSIQFGTWARLLYRALACSLALNVSILTIVCTYNAPPSVELACTYIKERRVATAVAAVSPDRPSASPNLQNSDSPSVVVVVVVAAALPPRPACWVSLSRVSCFWSANNLYWGGASHRFVSPSWKEWLSWANFAVLGWAFALYIYIYMRADLSCASLLKSWCIPHI